MAHGSEEGLGFSSEDYDSLIATTDVELLKRTWRNEKASPEILQFQASLVQRSREQIQLMEDTMEEFAKNGTDPLTVSLYQMDLDRALFLLRSYLRTRLQKIEKYFIHISKSELWNRLSEQEQKFAKKCTDYMEKHLQKSVLSHLPYGYQSILRQSISSEEDDMVPEPQLDTFVFCKSKGSVGAFQLDDSGDEIVDLVADDLYVLRYKSIKALIESEQIDLV
ncbi:DNA replication complex GINS protein SLD5-like [Macadamia integrifolia]|uniref:DNA replication complex GINS protein SLD5-like n=1 Tax=Macadamia integrifolia TaxID=60698 RepID=UPI001C4FA697|nr:DNA replication complex GINS protein SLD5-like [Macadamia integrifolia]XP_042516645.1 DNA replication complex GINS protein SLD5-like [Macadamia integrifolia]